jgi:putative addiction module CopG family antidote
MATVEKVSIALSSDMLRMVRAAVKTGDYATTSEVVRDALRQWKRTRGGSQLPLWPLSALQHDQVQRLCEQYGVRRLAIFGSALGADFSPTSDIDLVADFDELGVPSSVDQYFGFKSGLESLFERPVDLVELGAMPESRLKRHIQQTQQLVYGKNEAA